MDDGLVWTTAVAIIIAFTLGMTLFIVSMMGIIISVYRSIWPPGPTTGTAVQVLPLGTGNEQLCRSRPFSVSDNRRRGWDGMASVSGGSGIITSSGTVPQCL